MTLNRGGIHSSFAIKLAMENTNLTSTGAVFPRILFKMCALFVVN